MTEKTLQNQVPPRAVRNFWLILSCIPLALLAVQVAAFAHHWALGLAAVYLLPPLLVRLIQKMFGVRAGRFSSKSKEFLGWMLSYQVQVLFLRVPLLEEIIRFVPRLYSVWLRLWGSKVGKAVTWSPGVLVIDRGLVDIGNYSLLGYGTRMTSHHFMALPEGGFELLIGIPQVGVRAILGGESGLAPGAIVDDFEMLPATFDLAPNYIWKNGRRHSQNPTLAKPVEHLPREMDFQ